MKTILLLLCSISLMATNKCDKKTGLGRNSTPMVQLETHGCRGYCPAYKLTFMTDGVVTYEGLRNMVKMGKDTIELSVAEFKRLNAALKTLNLWQYPEQIESRVADAPSSSITVYNAEKNHRVTGSIDRPKPILEFESLLKDLAEAHGLKVKEGVNPYEAPANQKEILVKFKSDINPGNFMMQFQEVKLRIVRRVSAENLWLIGYNPDQITEKQLIDMLKGMDGVLEAKPNK